MPQPRPRPSPLIGRERELAELRGLLADEHRLVTVTGPGGVGKSRLASELGGILVPLAEARSRADIEAATSRALDMRSASVSSIARRVSGGKLTLVFDDAEHLAAELGELAGAIAAELERGHLVVTSRVSLGVDGETRLELRPLAERAAMDLFIARAVVADSYLDVEAALDDIRAIALRLDCLPLAIELAAARSSVLGPAELRLRLEEGLGVLPAGGRHHDVRASIEWSLSQLDDDERDFLAELSVFRAGFSEDAAVEVTSAGERAPALLASLADKSLLGTRESTQQLALLSAIREVAGTHLGDADLVRERHARHYAEQARAIEKLRRRSGLERALSSIRTHYDDMRFAFGWATEHEPELAVDLLLGLDPLLSANAIGKRRQLSDELLAALPIDHARRPVVVRIAGECLELQGDSKAAEELYLQAFEATDMSEPSLLAGRLHINLANTCSYRSDYQGALEHYGSASRIFEALEHLEYQSLAHTNTASILRKLGQVGQAQTHYQQALELAEKLGDWMRIALTLGFGAELFTAAGDYARARTALEQSRQVRAMFDRKHLRFVLQHFDAGEIERFEGNYAAAEQLYRETLEQAEELGYGMGMGGAHFALGAVLATTDRLPEARYHLERSIELLSSSTWAWLALARAYLALLQGAAGDGEACRQSIAAARRVAEVSNIATGALEVALPVAEALADGTRPIVAQPADDPEARFAGLLAELMVAGGSPPV
ncbi:MAG: tetratricopeptide repeat protein, partial [Deltaproteobacteria bacterium]|nr:tetratricopeptide repeat protein [Deltaproteobacteria bacterium]